MNQSFGTPAGFPGFSTPAATTTAPDSGAAKQVRFDTPAAATSASTLSMLLSDSNTTKSAIGLPSLGASTTTQGFSFGATTTTATPGFSFGAATTTATGTLGLSTAAPTLGGTLTGSTGFGIGLTSSASTVTGGFGGLSAASGFGGVSSTSGLGGLSSTSSLGGFSAASGLGGVSSCLSSSKAPVGLGGIGPTTATSSGSSAAKAGDAKTLKEMEIPAPILEVVNQFIKNVKEQKKVREEIARMSSKPLHQVEEDVKNLHQQLMTVSSTLQRYTSAIDRLKQDSIVELRNADIAQRTRDTPLGLQFENTAPCDYFERLVEDFLSRMSIYRQQISETEAHLASVSAGTNGGTSPQDLEILLTRLNEGFLSVTAHLQGIHEAVRAQKEAYLRYRKTVHSDYSAGDAFNRQNANVGLATTKAALPPSVMGLSPFASHPMGFITSNVSSAGGVGFSGQGGAGSGMLLGGSGMLGTGSSGGIFGNNPATSAPGLFGSGGASLGFGTATSGFGSNTGGLFGGTTAQNPGAGLFGAQTTQNLGAGLFSGTSVASGGFFSGTSTAPGGLFSGNTTTSGGLFSGTSAQPGGLFSGAAALPAGGGLFSGTAAPASGGLLGGTSTQTSGLFGSGAAASPAGGGLFSGNATQTGSIFGGPSTQSGTLFGSASTPASGLFGAAASPAGGGLFGAAQKPTFGTNRPLG